MFWPWHLSLLLRASRLCHRGLWETTDARGSRGKGNPSPALGDSTSRFLDPWENGRNLWGMCGMSKAKISRFGFEHSSRFGDTQHVESIHLSKNILKPNVHVLDFSLLWRANVGVLHCGGFNYCRVIQRSLNEQRRAGLGGKLPKLGCLKLKTWYSVLTLQCLWVHPHINWNPRKEGTVKSHGY